MQKSTRNQQQALPLAENNKQNMSKTHGQDTNQNTNKQDQKKTNYSTTTAAHSKVKEKTIIHETPLKQETNFSQESQNMEFIEKRADTILQEAVSLGIPGKSENEEENVNFEERIQGITGTLQNLLENFFNKSEGLENWLKESLTMFLQTSVERLNEKNQSLENCIKEKNELMGNTSQALSLAASVQKYLKENQKLWSFNY